MMIHLLQLLLKSPLSAFLFILILTSACEDHQSTDEIIALKADSLPEVVDYNLHIRPILSDKCFNCHGPDKNKREGNLALHTSEEAYKDIEGNFAIVPGKPHLSEAMI